MGYKTVIGRDEGDKKKFGDKGLVFLGKQYVKMGTSTSLSNEVYMDVAKAHVVLVSGKRGQGKCLLGDTLIQLDDGRQVPIQNLKDNDSCAVGLDNNLKIKQLEKNDFFEREVEEILYLKLRSGKEIKLTPEHPLLTVKGWRPAEELNLGSRIATPRKIDVFGSEVMEDYKIKILAYLIAEGHTRQSWVLFSNSDEIILNDFKESIFRFDKDLQVDLHSKPGCYRVANKDNRYSFRENPVKSWLKSLGCYGYYAKEKWIPEEIFKLNKESLSLFLSRLFSCDGSLYKTKNSWEISYSSSSSKLIKQVQNILLRFGVISKLRTKTVKCNKKEFETFELLVNSENTVKFIEEIGFFGEKAKKQEQCLNEVITVVKNPNVDTIPKGIWDIYRPSNWAEIGRGFGYAYAKAMRERIRYCPSRKTLLQIAEIDKNEQLRLLAQSDIFWDEIIEMKIMEGKFKVYDISVPNFHNFVANDIIVHNSYSLSVMAEEMARLPDEVSKNLSVVMLDTMGIFWTMKYPNERDEDLLREWGLKPEKLEEVDVYVPEGYFEKYKEMGVDADFSFSIKVSELNAGDWSNIFEVSLVDPLGIMISRILEEVRDKYEDDFSIDDILEFIEKDKRAEKNVKDGLFNMFSAAKGWGLFSREGTPVSKIIKRGRVSILDVSVYDNQNIKALVIGLLGRKLLKDRLLSRKMEEIQTIGSGYSYFSDLEEDKEQVPFVWLMIDEAHEFLPKEGKVASSDALIQLLREGRQPGISLVLATQQPGEIHTDVMTQSDIVVSHRVTAKKDIDALNSMMQSYLVNDIQRYLGELPRLKGSAIILDDNSERIYPMRVRPKLSWHGGETPSAVKVRKLDLGL